MYPQPLKEAVVEMLKVYVSTRELKQVLTGINSLYITISRILVLPLGALLEKIINDTQALINGELIPSNRKLFLYSAHEVNVFHLLTVLGEDVKSMVPHSAYIMLEVHKINETYSIQVSCTLYLDLNVCTCLYFRFCTRTILRKSRIY